ncbi:MAG TPA: aminoacyl-tRNA hydrolase [Stellaceae bacterium]|jgi:PTH1 family peptidyl-tRNA hydrolase|nr:aminoacyl-tRNA hydrolase [Stellaceae bacterium]
MRLLVGLGNPGSRYAMNRHNLGFMALDAIAQRYRLAPFRGKFQGALAEGMIGETRVMALKPETFMNASGDSVGAAARFYKIEPGAIAVIHDDIDLVEGKLRVKRGGGDGGHNGLRSIDDAIGPDYWRVRVGVGHPGRKELVEPYVLQNFLAEEKLWLEPLLAAIAEAAPLLVHDDAPGFMTKVALILKPNKPKAPPPARDTIIED